jgi:hypothetical protein
MLINYQLAKQVFSLYTNQDITSTYIVLYRYIAYEKLASGAYTHYIIDRDKRGTGYRYKDEIPSSIRETCNFSSFEIIKHKNIAYCSDICDLFTRFMIHVYLHASGSHLIHMYHLTCCLDCFMLHYGLDDLASKMMINNPYYDKSNKS